MVQDGHLTQTGDSHTDWLAVWVGVAVAVVILAMIGLGFKAVIDNTRLQESFNTAVVACVKAGGEPLSCRISLSGDVAR